MQISHQHNKIIYSQYGNHCRIDGFGDIPGQVVSALDLTIFWTTKSALVLVSGMSLLIVKKFPCAGLLMVREANGQNKSRFAPSMLGTIFLVMTVSHYSCRGRNRWQSAHELMSSQAREKSALKIDLQICVIPLTTTVALFLRVLCYFGCSCIYVQ